MADKESQLNEIVRAVNAYDKLVADRDALVEALELLRIAINSGVADEQESIELNRAATLHLGPRERKSIARKDLSAEIKTAGKRGLVRITDLTGGVEPEPEKPTATDDTAADEAKTTSKRRK